MKFFGERGAVSELGNLEKVLIPHPRSSWVEEIRLIRFAKWGTRSEKVLKRKEKNFGVLYPLIEDFTELLKEEGVKYKLLWFYPSLSEMGEKELLYDEEDVTALSCNGGPFSVFLRDLGIFSSKDYFATKFEGWRKEVYGNLAKELSKLVGKEIGKEKIKEGAPEGGGVVSDGNVTIISVIYEDEFLKVVKELEEEFGNKLIAAPSMNMHVDAVLNFPERGTVVYSHSSVKYVKKNVSQTERVNLSLSVPKVISEFLEKELGYRRVVVDDDEVTPVDSNFLVLKSGKVMTLDRKGRFSKRLEREGIDVLNLYDEKLEKVYRWLLAREGGMRCLCLPVKRRYVKTKEDYPEESCMRKKFTL